MQVDWLYNIKDVIEMCQLNPRTNDSMSTQRTILMALASTKKLSPLEVKKLGQQLGCKSHHTFRKKWRLAVRLKRETMSEEEFSGELLQKFRRKCKTRFTPEFVHDLQQWMLHNNKLVAESPKTDDSVHVKNVLTGEIERHQKAFKLLTAPY